MTFMHIDDNAPQSQRRLWALSPFISFIVVVAAYGAVSRTDGPTEVVAAIIAGLAAVVALVCAYAVYSWQREWAHRPDNELDERERISRDSAYRSAYSALATAGALALVGSQIALDVVDDLSITEISSIAVLGWFMLAICLPSSVLLWREDDLPAADLATSES